MEDVFMFMAQSKQGKAAVMKEKPPDPNTSSKRTQAANEDNDNGLRKSSGDNIKSKPLGISPPSNWSGFSVDKGKLKIGEGDVMIIEGTKGSTKNSGLAINSSKTNNGFKSSGGSSSHGADMNGKGVGSRKMVDKTHMALTGYRVVQTSKNGNSCNISSGGSRFAILSEEGAKERPAKKALNPSLERVKGVSNSVLSKNL